MLPAEYLSGPFGIVPHTHIVTEASATEDHSRLLSPQQSQQSQPTCILTGNLISLQAFMLALSGIGVARQLKGS